MKVTVTEYNDHKGPIQWPILTSLKVVLEHFSQALTVFQILYDFQKFCDPENIGHGHNVQHLVWRHSIANIILEDFLLVLIVFQILYVMIFTKYDRENIGHGHNARSQWCHSISNI